MESRSTRGQSNFQAIILRRLDAYGEGLRNIEQEVCITFNATNSGIEEIEGVKKARRVLEIKMLKTFDFMDGKLDYIHERIDEIGRVVEIFRLYKFKQRWLSHEGHWVYLNNSIVCLWRRKRIIICINSKN